MHSPSAGFLSTWALGAELLSSRLGSCSLPTEPPTQVLVRLFWKSLNDSFLPSLTLQHPMADGVLDTLSLKCLSPGISLCWVGEVTLLTLVKAVTFWLCILAVHSQPPLGAPCRIPSVPLPGLALCSSKCVYRTARFL